MLRPSNLTATGKLSLQNRFSLVASLTIGISTFLFSALLWHYQLHEFNTRLVEVIKSQSETLLSSHQHERKTSQFLQLQRLLRSIPQVESVALFDKNCSLLTPSLDLQISGVSCASKQKNILSIPYTDVLSPIGHAVLKINLPKTSTKQVISWFAFSFFVFFLAYAILHFAWRFFIYRPLQGEIKDLTMNGHSSIREFGVVGQSLREAFLRIREQETALVKKRYEEEKVTDALRVAHDILTPIRSIQSQTAPLSPELQREIRNLENIALSLLPEKKSTILKAVSLISQLQLVAERTGQPARFKIQLQDELRVIVSEVHFQRALLNILNNALEALPDSVVEISARSTASTVSIHVRDFGPGIPLHLTADLPTTKLTGSGLGIASARAHLSAMKATLAYSWAEPGTIAEITLEKAPVVRSATLIEDDKYVRARWMESAKEAGIQLVVFDSLPAEIPKTDVIYLDRYLGDLDTNAWSIQQKSQGINIVSISSLDGSKSPPWN